MLQPVDDLHPQPGQLVLAAAQQPHHFQVLIVGGQFAQPAGVHRDSSYGVRVGLVGLAALPGVEHPDPGGLFRRHVQHPFPVPEQPLRERTTGAAGALDRPSGVATAART
jgi:hypothetical protein